MADGLEVKVRTTDGNGITRWVRKVIKGATLSADGDIIFQNANPPCIDSATKTWKITVDDNGVLDTVEVV